MNYNIERFIEPHELYYPVALMEIKYGHKRSHWMWYIFPQLKGLGYSSKSEFYGLTGVEEAKQYMNNDYLKNNMYEICEELLKLDDNIDNIFGYPDNLKLKSSMTLFEYAIPDSLIFKEIIDKFYNGNRDEKTLEILKNSNN